MKTGRVCAEAISRPLLIGKDTVSSQKRICKLMRTCARTAMSWAAQQGPPTSKDLRFTAGCALRMMPPS